jgi:hypothetical protein
MKDVKYIPETKSWLIDGRIVEEKDLTQVEILELKKKSSSELEFLRGESSPKGQLLI